MKHKQIYATQGGGYAIIIGPHAYFTEELNVPGAYHFKAGDMVPDEWDLTPVGPRESLTDLNNFE